VLCDDHRLLVEAFATALRGHGHDVVATATTPEDGYRAVLQHEPEVCVLDLFFPGGSGLDAARKITSANSACKVLILSARSDPDLILAALAAGAAGFVLKEQSIDGILRALDRVGAGEAAVDPHLLRAAIRLPSPRRPAESQPLRYLTRREREALRRITEGESTKEIARGMQVSLSTARTHVQNVLTKLGVNSRLQAAALVAREGLADELDSDLDSEAPKALGPQHLSDPPTRSIAGDKLLHRREALGPIGGNPRIRD
jgi:DNA-binding NarL/FixJ family response regulator